MANTVWASLQERGSALTRDMSAFFTSFGVEGVFLASMINAAQVQPKDVCGWG